MVKREFTLKKLINRVESTRLKYDEACSQLEEKVREVCDFNARITYCEGDSHLVLNEETTSVATLTCLKGKNIKNKLTEEQHEKFGI